MLLGGAFLLFLYLQVLAPQPGASQVMRMSLLRLNCRCHLTRQLVPRRDPLHEQMAVFTEDWVSRRHRRETQGPRIAHAAGQRGLSSPRAPASAGAGQETEEDGRKEGSGTW